MAYENVMSRHQTFIVAEDTAFRAIVGGAVPPFAPLAARQAASPYRKLSLAC